MAGLVKSFGRAFSFGNKKFSEMGARDPHFGAILGAASGAATGIATGNVGAAAVGTILGGFSGAQRGKAGREAGREERAAEVESIQEQRKLAEFNDPRRRTALTSGSQSSVLG